jgi:hypothetical protein
MSNASFLQSRRALQRLENQGRHVRPNARSTLAALRIAKTDGGNFGEIENCPGSPGCIFADGVDPAVESSQQKRVELTVFGIPTLVEEEGIVATTTPWMRKSRPTTIGLCAEFEETGSRTTLSDDAQSLHGRILVNQGHDALAI